MSTPGRATLLVLSAIDCGFGLLALFGPSSAKPLAFLVNFALAVVLAFLTGRDLMARGVRLGWLVGLSYLFAPLIGLILYALFSGSPLSRRDGATVR